VLVAGAERGGEKRKQESVGDTSLGGAVGGGAKKKKKKKKRVCHREGGLLEGEATIQGEF